jgi:uncharacterized membrane protein
MCAMPNQNLSLLETGALRIGLSRSATPDEHVGAALTRTGEQRLDTVDLLRGLVIAIMVLDHVRNYLHSQAFVFDPTDPARTTLLIYMTRWITHLCAPTFVFLAGVAIFLQQAHGKTGASLARFLVTRGAWLIVLEFTLMSFGFNFGWPFLFVQVIWAIGASMVLMALCVQLPRRAVLLVGALIVVGHQLLANVDASALGPVAAVIWRFSMQPGPVIGVPGIVIYPFIPWFGVMCLGYGLGHVFTGIPERRNRTLLALGAAAIVAFVLLRSMNLYGDPAPWSAQASAIQSAMSFLNVSKYPPSVLYVLVTLGVSMVLYVALDRARGPVRNVLLSFGRTPLFTYLVHIYLVHTVALIVGVLGGIPASNYVHFLNDLPSHAGIGFDLRTTYLVWAATLILLVPCASWFARVKRRRRDWWLSYL